MYPYFIGSGVLLEAGVRAGAAPATLHAQTDAALAATVRAAAIDFESSTQNELARLVLAISGWTGSAFDRQVMAPLRARGAASLADVLAAHARAGGDDTVHLFARWLPGEALLADLSARGVSLVAHPLEAIERASLVTGQRSSTPLTLHRAA